MRGIFVTFNLPTGALRQDAKPRTVWAKPRRILRLLIMFRYYSKDSKCPNSASEATVINWVLLLVLFELLHMFQLPYSNRPSTGLETPQIRDVTCAAWSGISHGLGRSWKSTEQWWNDDYQGKWETYASTTSFTTNLIWNHPRLNRALRNEKLASNLLSYGTGHISSR
jgi:hypothetical protein